MNSSKRDFAPPTLPSHLRTRDYRNQNRYQNQNQNRNYNRNCNHNHNDNKEQLKEKQHQHQHQTFGGSSLIQSNSVQNQFTTLSNQRDNFIHERDEAEKELKRVQAEHQCIKTEHDTLIESNRRAKEELGQRMEKLAMLKEEESRLCQLTENEFHAIYDCTKHSKGLETKKVDASKRYTSEIDPLNFELAALLERRIQKKTERCITVRSVERVVLPEFDKALLDNNKPQLLNQRKNLYESIELLKSASEQRKKYIALLGQLRGAQQKQQQQSGIETNKSTRASVNGALEGEGKVDASMRPNHVDLFYGPSNNDLFPTLRD